jgi:hypothetical protein
MIQVQAQEIFPASQLPSTSQIIALTGYGSPSMMGRQGALLAFTTHSLMKKVGLCKPIGSSAGTYCVLDATEVDKQVIEILSKPAGTLAKDFAEKISPMKNLRELPVVLAFWSSTVSGAGGPLRIFPRSFYALQQARIQAELDLAE